MRPRGAGGLLSVAYRYFTEAKTVVVPQRRDLQLCAPTGMA
jgi:hypothetical protein